MVWDESGDDRPEKTGLMTKFSLHRNVSRSIWFPPSNSSSVPSVPHLYLAMSDPHLFLFIPSFLSLRRSTLYSPNYPSILSLSHFPDFPTDAFPLVYTSPHTLVSSYTRKHGPIPFPLPPQLTSLQKTTKTNRTARSTYTAYTSKKRSNGLNRQLRSRSKRGIGRYESWLERDCIVRGTWPRLSRRWRI